MEIYIHRKIFRTLNLLRSVCIFYIHTRKYIIQKNTSFHEHFIEFVHFQSVFVHYKNNKMKSNGQYV